jgi:hypothetical protein
MTAYRLSGVGVVRAADGTFVSEDPRNRDWIAYQAWLGQGNTPDPAPPPPAVIPSQVTAGQLIRALNQLGMLASVDAEVAGADAMTQRLWARAPIFPRNDPMLIAMATSIGKTSGDIDAVFQLAETL